MDVQLATKANGTLHAVSVPQSLHEAQHFEATMQRQGLTVTRLTQAAAAVRFKRLKFADPEGRPDDASAAPAHVPVPGDTAVLPSAPVATTLSSTVQPGLW